MAPVPGSPLLSNTDETITSLPTINEETFLLDEFPSFEEQIKGSLALSLLETPKLVFGGNLEDNSLQGASTSPINFKFTFGKPRPKAVQSPAPSDPPLQSQNHHSFVEYPCHPATSNRTNPACCPNNQPTGSNPPVSQPTEDVPTGRNTTTSAKRTSLLPVPTLIKPFIGDTVTPLPITNVAGVACVIEPHITTPSTSPKSCSSGGQANIRQDDKTPPQVDNKKTHLEAIQLESRQPEADVEAVLAPSTTCRADDSLQSHEKIRPFKRLVRTARLAPGNRPWPATRSSSSQALRPASEKVFQAKIVVASQPELSIATREGTGNTSDSHQEREEQCPPTDLRPVSTVVLNSSLMSTEPAPDIAGFPPCQTSNTQQLAIESGSGLNDYRTSASVNLAPLTSHELQRSSSSSRLSILPVAPNPLSSTTTRRSLKRASYNRETTPPKPGITRDERSEAMSNHPSKKARLRPPPSGGQPFANFPPVLKPAKKPASRPSHSQLKSKAKVSVSSVKSSAAAYSIASQHAHKTGMVLKDKQELINKPKANPVRLIEIVKVAKKPIPLSHDMTENAPPPAEGTRTQSGRQQAVCTPTIAHSPKLSTVKRAKDRALFDAKVKEKELESERLQELVRAETEAKEVEEWKEDRRRIEEITKQRARPVPEFYTDIKKELGLAKGVPC